MIVAGKCPPEPRELQAADDRGFDHVELYLELRHLNDLEATRRAIEQSDVSVTSVHTPHVSLDGKRYLSRADRLAASIDAYLVVHSQHLLHTHIPELEELGFDAPYGYENNPGASSRFVENTILDRGFDLVLDTAHLFLAEETYVTTIDRLLDRYPARIPVIHLNDATLTQDGHAFGEGVMDLRRLARLLKRRFDGTLVLEVLPDDQADALDRFTDY